MNTTVIQHILQWNALAIYWTNVFYISWEFDCTVKAKVKFSRMLIQLDSISFNYYFIFLWLFFKRILSKYSSFSNQKIFLVKNKIWARIKVDKRYFVLYSIGLYVKNICIKYYYSAIILKTLNHKNLALCLLNDEYWSDLADRSLWNDFHWFLSQDSK